MLTFVADLTCEQRLAAGCMRSLMAIQFGPAGKSPLTARTGVVVLPVPVQAQVGRVIVPAHTLLARGAYRVAGGAIRRVLILNVAQEGEFAGKF